MEKLRMVVRLVSRASENMATANTEKRQSSKRKVLLAQQIVQLALQEKWKKGHHLVELQLVQTLGVSRSPVRSALKILEEHGVLSARQHHGFFLELDGAALSEVDLKIPRTEEEELYIALIESRAKGLDPERFTQTEMQRKYSVKRMVLINTLNRMADEGLIVRNAGQGWSFVPTLDSVQSRLASYEFRLSVEPAAIKTSTFKIDYELLTRQRYIHLDLLEAIKLKSTNSLWIYEIDSNFHETIARFSGNQFFVNAVVQQNRLRRILELWDGENLKRVEQWCHEHLEVISALERGKLPGASKLLEQHLASAARAAEARDTDTSGT
ncbi:MAG: GntR family transcriptional regulator [Roseovarius sp.]|nr:GntR family transcriptional regulator [Roseovarius sp.]